VTLATTVPVSYVDLIEPMASADAELRAALRAHGLTWETYPDLTGAARERGVAAALAYPMQGVLKYHGLKRLEVSHRLPAEHLALQRRRAYPDAG
jgi:hypothetical protein